MLAIFDIAFYAGVAEFELESTLREAVSQRATKHNDGIMGANRPRCEGLSYTVHVARKAMSTECLRLVTYAGDSFQPSAFIRFCSKFYSAGTSLGINSEQWFALLSHRY